VDGNRKFCREFETKTGRKPAHEAAAGKNGSLSEDAPFSHLFANREE
jgi:hypothetical protein